MIAKNIGPYHVLEKLGEGGMGVVYKARDPKLGRFVALKLLPPGADRRRDMRERFLNEARTASSLGHPNIVTIYDILEHDGADCIVMEFIPGQTLEQLLEHGALRSREAIDYAVQIADALAAAHRAGLIHRDLKPGNIMITPEGLVKVVDFGLAKLMAGTDSSEDQAATRKALTAGGAIIGTVAYMSPEQAEGKPLDARSDIFSYGAVLYEMLTGKRAFQGDSGASTLAAVLREDPLPLPNVVPEIAPGVTFVVESCLRKDPTKRLQHLFDVRLILESWGRAPDMRATSTPPHKPKRLLTAAILSTALATAAAGYFVWDRGSRQAAEARPIRLSRLTSGALASSPALSPDGNLVVYTRYSGQQAVANAFTSRASDLYLQPVRGGAEVRLTTGQAVIYNPVFSADGTRIYYISMGQPRGAFEVPITGGEPRLLIRDAQRIAPSPDGKWLAYTVAGRLIIRPTEGGPETVLLESSGLGAIWSPDSREILTTYFPGRSNADVVRVPVSGGAAKPTGLFSNLAMRNMAVTGITELKAWLPGDDLIFCGPMGAAANLYRISLHRVAEATPVPVSNGIGNNCAASIARDRLVFANQQFVSTIFALPANLNEAKITGELRRITAEGVESQFPDVRPDDSALAFISRRGEGQGAFLLDLRRGVTRPLASRERPIAYTTFSPDGSRVAFAVGGVEWPAFVVPADGGEPESVGGVYGRLRGWSPDGRYLLSWRQVGDRSSIGILDLTTRQAAEIIRSDKRQTLAPRFSPDGRWVVFSASPTMADVPDLYIAPFRGAAPVRESEWRLLVKNGANPVWSLDGRSLYFQQTADGIARLMRLGMEEQSRPKGEAAEFYRFEGRSPSGLLLNTLTASRDHLYMALLDGPSDIWAMDFQR